MNLPEHISRPPKLNHAQTMLYEIDMFRFAAGSLGEGNDLSAWRNLECFLLHFRNLIEFFGKEPKPGGDDLSILKPEAIWPDQGTRPSQDKLNRLVRKDLWQKYEVRDANAVNDKISRYLQHCTEQRVEGKSWNTREMFDELDPVMTEFEKLLPDKDRPWKTAPSVIARTLSVSQSTASSQIGMTQLDMPSGSKYKEK